MTAARQQRKRQIGFALAALAWLIGAYPTLAQTTEQVVTDTRTGLAISGFDPVAYFTDAAARLGLSDHEFGFAGVTWRFRNSGNRAAFAANPEVYAPQYGGYDPVAIVRGASVPGHPQIWLVHAEKLYLFYDAKARAAFAAEPERFIENADHQWPAVRQTLAR